MINNNIHLDDDYADDEQAQNYDECQEHSYEKWLMIPKAEKNNVNTLS